MEENQGLAKSLTEPAASCQHCLPAWRLRPLRPFQHILSPSQHHGKQEKCLGNPGVLLSVSWAQELSYTAREAQTLSRGLRARI